MENYINKIKCDACNKYYTIKYIPYHNTSFKHIENEYLQSVEDYIVNQLEDYST